MSNNTNLFGCCSGERNGIIREYQRILAKALIEDRDFYDEVLPGLDINETFFGEPATKTIVGNLIDMRARYESEVTYEALEMEVLRRVSNDYDREEITELFGILKRDIPAERLEMCKEQFLYWRQFVMLAKIGNACVDMLREPWFVGDAKLNKMIGEVRDLAGRLSPVGAAFKKSNDWTE